VKVIYHDRSTFQEAVDSYERRPDQDWGLTDYASFLIMDRLGMDEALTADRHFQQAGYKALLLG
jgi:predicted nucleic acid-binding protein